MTKLITKKDIGNLQIELRSEVDENGKIWDTEVKIGEENLCWISGEQLVEFTEKFNELINNYRI